MVPFDEITHRNVLGAALEVCSTRPMTGWFRNGCCQNDPSDRGKHLICVELTAEFLSFSKSVGNDLSTPRPEFDFPGLKPGDRWCLCASRWKEALEAGKAPRVILNATHRQMLDWATLEELEHHRVQP